MNEEIVNAYVESMFNFGHTAYLFSIDVVPLSVLPTLHGGSCFPTSVTPHFLLHLFGCGHPNGCEVASPCGLDLHLSNH